jgi:hypothetical protein
LCDRPADRAPRRQDGVALAMLVPGLAATIALAGASHGALLDHAWRSSPAATGDVAAPSQMEQSTEVAGGPSQLVRSDRLFGLLPGRSLRFAKR